LDYYTSSTKDQLIEDIVIYHRHLEKPIYKLIEKHSSWGNPLIMEGWALYPGMMSEIKDDNVFAVWLIAEDGLLAERLTKSGFLQDADNPGKAIENYLYRSEWHNRKLLEQCRKTHQKHLMINQHTIADEIADCIYEMLIS